MSINQKLKRFKVYYEPMDSDKQSSDKVELKEMDFVFENDKFQRSLKRVYKSVNKVVKRKEPDAKLFIVKQTTQTKGILEHYDTTIDLEKENKSYVRIVFEINRL